MALDGVRVGVARFGLMNMATRIIVVVALVVSAARIILETRNCYFFSDDFLNFIIAQEMGPTWRYFIRDVFGEFVPLFRAINIIYFKTFGLAFWPFRMLLVLFQWCVILVIAGLARGRLIGPAILLPVLTLTACSPIFDTQYQWWSASINVLTEAMASLIAIQLMANTHPLTARQKYGATTAYVTGMLFFPKALLLAPVLLGIRLFAGLERGDPLLRALRSASLDLLPVVLSGCVYVSVVVLGGYGSHAPLPSTATILGYIWRGWNHGFLTGVFGLDRGFFGRVALANVAFAILIAASLWKSLNAVVLWLGFAVYFIAAMGVTAINRAMIFGLDSSEWGRYYADIFCVAVALFVIGRNPANSDIGSDARQWMIWPSAALSIAGAAYLLLATSRAPFLWFVPPIRVAAFVANVSASAAQAPENTTVEDGVVPGWIMPPWTSPLSRYRYFLMLFPSHVTAVPVNNAQLRVSEEGRFIATAHR